MATDFLPTTPDCEIITSRTVKASIKDVFRAWTDPDHLKNWWGPKGFTNTFSEFDLRPGGKWIFVMHGPDKGNYPNECEFIKIEAPTFIAWKHLSKPLFDVAVRFEEVAEDSTKIVFRMIFNSPQECNKVKAFAQDKNEENLDKLEGELLKMTS